MNRDEFVSAMAARLRQRDIDGDETPISGPWGSKMEPYEEPAPAVRSKVEPVVEPVVESVDELAIGLEQKAVADVSDALDVPVEKPKLPFSEGGRLVGERYYGPEVIQGVKKSKTVPVFDDDFPEMVNAPASASSCVLL